MKVSRVLISVLLVLFFAGLVYLLHPAFNVHTLMFWFFAIIFVGLVSLIIYINGYDNDKAVNASLYISGIGIIGLIVIGLILGLASTGLFNAKTLSTMLEPQETTFEEHVEDF